MNILYINPTPIHGGAEEILIQIMTDAKTYGHKPQLLVPYNGWLTEQCKMNSIPTHILETIPDHKCGSAPQQLKHSIVNNLSIIKLLKRLFIDVVHANTPRIAYHAGIACSVRGVPLVVHVHDIVNSPYLSRSKALYLARVSDATITVSDAVKDCITSTVQPRMIKRIYNGVNLQTYADINDSGIRQSYGIDQKDILFGTISAMFPWKGQDVVIKAFSRIAAQTTNTRLIVVGGARGEGKEKAHENHIRGLVADLCLAERIIFTGWTEKALEIMKSLDVFVHAPTQPDPFPTVIIHAMVLGKPIIAANIGGIPEMTGNGSEAVLFTPGDSDKLGQIMLRLHSNTAERHNLATKALRGSAKFDHKIMANEINDIYIKLSRHA